MTTFQGNGWEVVVGVIFSELRYGTEVITFEPSEFGFDNAEVRGFLTKNLNLNPAELITKLNAMVK
jgi:hypothetical protein